MAEYRDAAIDDPTSQNVALYLYLQRVALDKSSRFAAATQRAVQLDPFLDEITQRPTATFAANLTNWQAGDNRDAVLERIAKTALAFVLVLVLLPAAQADDPPGTGIGNQMTAMFNTMLNYTEPTAHLGQRRGVLTGGSLNARNRIMNESLWHFVPPSFDAGCGGIDLFAGSFSFLSAEQFQNLLRAIAANAAGYAPSRSPWGPCARSAWRPWRPCRRRSRP
jgi:hypothetical protein